MKNVIRKEIREYILDDVNTSLSRLGVFEGVKEVRETDNSYEFESGNIHQMPKMFKKIYINGNMVKVEVDKGSRFYQLSQKHDIVAVNINWRWNSFTGGYNGETLGRIIYALSKDLPESFDDFCGNYSREYYVRKLEGITI